MPWLALPQSELDAAGLDHHDVTADLSFDLNRRVSHQSCPSDKALLNVLPRSGASWTDFSTMGRVRSTPRVVGGRRDTQND